MADQSSTDSAVAVAHGTAAIARREVVLAGLGLLSSASLAAVLGGGRDGDVAAAGSEALGPIERLSLGAGAVSPGEVSGAAPILPLLPGALLVAEVTEVLRRVPAMVARLGAMPTLAAVKFLAPVRPGSELLIELLPETGAARGVRFEVRQGDTVAASGRWVAGATAPAPVERR